MHRAARTQPPQTRFPAQGRGEFGHVLHLPLAVRESRNRAGTVTSCRSISTRTRCIADSDRLSRTRSTRRVARSCAAWPGRVPSVTKPFQGVNKTFQGLLFQGNRGMRLRFSYAGVEKYVPVSYTGPLRGRDMVAARLERPNPCGIECSFLASTGHAHWAEYQPATVRLAPCESHGVQAARRADLQNGRPQ